MEIIVWKTEHTIAQLEKEVTLTPVELSYYHTISSEHRRLEWLTSRWMVRREIGKNVSTIYDGRKPSLVGSEKQISISHSDDLVVLMIADTQCGVDIENSTRDFSRVSKRFLSPEELAWMNCEEIALAWSIKEAAYKMIGDLEIDFATMFHIKKIDRENGLSILSYQGVDYQLSIRLFGIYNIAFGCLNVD